MYHVELHRSADKALRSLPREDQERIGQTLAGLAGDPFPRGAIKVQGYRRTLFRVRIGTHRVLYHVDEERKAILVDIIDKRSRVYDRL